MNPLNPTVIQHGEDNYEFLLENCEIYYVDIINFGFCEITTTDRELKIMVPGPGEYIADGQKYSIDGENPATLIPMKRLVGTTCKRLQAFETGLLEVEFSNGDILRLPPDDQYENWDFIIVIAEGCWWLGSSPGGGIWVFGPDSKITERPKGKPD